MVRRLMLVVALACAGAGCTTDCDVLCRTRASCFETGESADECAARCDAEAADPEGADRVAACAECVDGLACEEVTDRCYADCL